MNNLTFGIYLLFLVSFFLRLPTRIHLLGIIRFDLLLIGLVGVSLFFSNIKQSQGPLSQTSKILLVLWVFILLDTPFSTWPGSAIRSGIPNMVAVAIFYYYTIGLVDCEKRLKTFILVFVACESFRVFEPLYLHLTTGYWGDATNMGGPNLLMMPRLAGAPSDTANPNGLAFVICSIIPFYHYLLFQSSLKSKLLYIAVMPLLVYALVLTASRSGFLAFLMILLGIFMKTKRKVLMVLVMAVCASIFVGHLSPLERDRYLSIGDTNVPGGETSKGRIQGVIDNFKVAMERPIFGHGLGTSTEANFHATGLALRSHNLYTEILQELGFPGLFIFLALIYSVISNFRLTLKDLGRVPNKNSYLLRLGSALQVWLMMNLLFSFASYGLTSCSWFLFAGLSVIVRRLAQVAAQQVADLQPVSVEASRQ